MLTSFTKWNPIVALEIPLIKKATAAKGKFVWTDEMEKVYDLGTEGGRLGPFPVSE